MIQDFASIIAPLTPETFEREYLGRKPLYLETGPERFREVMNWQVLNRLLGMNTIWSQASLELVLDGQRLPPQAYASPAPGRDGGQVLRPEVERVKGYLRRGATLVLNDIDQLTPELSAFCRALENALGCRVQANLYMSSKKRQGFHVHADNHDVLAVHFEGEKRWFVFEGRAEWPIAHRMFESIPQEVHEKAKGELWREVRMKPGDLLYLPRGQYHYALAEEGGCIHIAFGLTWPIGLDVMSYLYERMVQESLGRQDLPRREEELRDYLQRLGERLRDLASDAKTLADLKALQRRWRWPRETYDLPDLLTAPSPRFRLKARGLKLLRQNGKQLLVDQRNRRAVEVPEDYVPLVSWVLARDGFPREAFDAAFSDRPKELRERVLKDLEAMAVVAPA